MAACRPEKKCGQRWGEPLLTAKHVNIKKSSKPVNCERPETAVNYDMN